MPSMIQPGVRIRHVKGQPGTLGTFALRASGEVALIGAEHTITNHWRARLGDPIILEPTGSRWENARDRFFRRLSINPRFTLSLRIKGIGEDLPAVLKRPVDPIQGMNVIKFGWRTKITTGRIVSTDSPVIVPYKNGWTRTLPDLIKAEIETDHGDSGALLLSAEGYRPIGFLEAKDKDNPNVSYFIKARRIAEKNGLLGFYCPMEMPQNSTDEFRTVTNEMIPDGYFQQVEDCANRDWRRVARTIGLGFPGFEQVEPFDHQETDAERSTRPGEDVRYVGRLVVNRQGKVISLVFAGSRVASVGIKVSKIEAAFGLRLIGAFGW